MTLPTWHRLIQRLFRPAEPRRRKGRRPRSRRLQCEPLEGRCLPSTFTTVYNLLHDAAPEANIGFYVKPVGAPTPLAFHENQQFEPASMIKVLIHLHAMRQVQAGTANLNETIHYRALNPFDPNDGNICPDNAFIPQATTLEHGLQLMMQNSDNRLTQAVEQRFGGGLNITLTTGALVGMPNSILSPFVTIGCGTPGNYLTLADTGRLYEQVENGALLQPFYRSKFYALMLNGGMWQQLRNVATQEAAAQLSKPAADPAVLALVNAFSNDVSWDSKGGSYTLSSGFAGFWREIRTLGEMVRLPYHNAAQQTTLKGFFVGEFVENFLSPMANPQPRRDQVANAMKSAEVEMLRDEVHDALATWRPAAVTSLTATPMSDHQINLSWPAVPGAAGYKIELGSGQFWGEVGTTGAGVTAFASYGLTGGSHYSYRVRAYGLGGNGAYSPVASATTYVSAPANLMATPISDHQINLSWPAVPGAAGYKIELGGGQFWGQVGTTGAGITTFASTGLTAGSQYSYRVRGYNVSGDGAYSPVASATTYVTAPLSLMATAASNSQINLSWSAVNGTAGYKVERSPNGVTGWTQITVTAANVTAFGDTGLNAATPYYYRVRGYNVSGDGYYSPTASATTYVAAPASLTALAASTAQINLTWSAVAGTAGYKIERSPDGAGSWALVANVGPNVTTTGDTGLVASTTYYYRVRGYNVNGDGAPSPVASATTFAVVSLQLSITPNTAPAGAAFSITVIARDPFNNPAAGYRGTVTFSTSDPTGGLLPIDYPFTAQDAGSHTFPNLGTLYTAGPQTVTARDMADNSLLASAPITITPDVPAVFAIGAPDTVLSGTPFDFTVTVQDAYGNTVPTYTGTVTFFSNTDPAAVMPPDYTFTAQDAGTATFAGGATLFALGVSDLSASDGVNALAGNVALNVVAGGAFSGRGGSFSLPAGMLDRVGAAEHASRADRLELSRLPSPSLAKPFASGPLQDGTQGTNSGTGYTWHGKAGEAAALDLFYDLSALDERLVSP